MRVKWKPFLAHNIEGRAHRDDASKFNEDLDLLTRIEQMRPGKPISVHAAYDMYWLEIADHLVGDFGGGSDAAADIFSADWVSWISAQGFKIILNGNEFEIQFAA